MMYRALQAERARVIGSPLRRDAALRARQRRPTDDAALSRLIAGANAKIAGLVSRLERERNAMVTPPTLRAEIEREAERFKNRPQDHRYRYVELADVPEATKAALRDGVQRAVNRLAGISSGSPITPPLPTPSVRYFRAAKPGEQADFEDHRVLYGQHIYGTNFIDVRADLRPPQARVTAAHEVFHWSNRHNSRDEDAAARFARDMGFVV